MRWTQWKRKRKWDSQSTEENGNIKCSATKKLKPEENESYQSLQIENPKTKTLIFAEKENIGSVHKFCHCIGIAKIKWIKKTKANHFQSQNKTKT